MKHAALTTAVAATLLDPARIVMTAIVLGRVRREHPEMFDGSLAAAVVNQLAEEAQQT